MAWWRRKKPALPSAEELLTQLRHEDAGACRLREGLSADEVAAVEQALGRPLPEELRRLLRFSNGVDLFGGNSVLYGMHRGGPPYEWGDLVKTAKEHARLGLLPDGALEIGGHSTSVLVLWHPERGYALFDPEDGEEFQIETSLARWLEREIESWRQLEADEESTR